MIYYLISLTLKFSKVLMNRKYSNTCKTSQQPYNDSMRIQLGYYII